MKRAWFFNQERNAYSINERNAILFNSTSKYMEDCLLTGCNM